MNFMTPIESPNLPKRGVTLAAVSVGAEKAKEYLLSRGISVFDILPCTAITDGTAAHADLHLLHLGGRKIILSREQCNNAEKLIEMGFDVQVLDTPLGDKYPADVPLNAALFGNYAILNPKTVCKNIDFSGRSLIPVRQGYTKCSVCVVDENSIITADNKIAAIASAAGMNVLRISETITALDGFEHGFIGGASFKINRNEMAFTGIINDTAERLRIERFLNERGIHAVYLTEESIFDIGSAIPIAEEI